MDSSGICYEKCVVYDYIVWSFKFTWNMYLFYLPLYGL